MPAKGQGVFGESQDPGNFFNGQNAELLFDALRAEQTLCNGFGETNWKTVAGFKRGLIILDALDVAYQDCDGSVLAGAEVLVSRVGRENLHAYADAMSARLRRIEQAPFERVS